VSLFALNDVSQHQLPTNGWWLPLRVLLAAAVVLKSQYSYMDNIFSIVFSVLNFDVALLVPELFIPGSVDMVRHAYHYVWQSSSDFGN
jgi:hypothetical protein